MLKSILKVDAALYVSKYRFALISPIAVILVAFTFVALRFVADKVDALTADETDKLVAVASPNTGVTKVLLLKISVPNKVDKVPETGKVILVGAVDTSDVEKFPKVANAPSVVSVPAVEMFPPNVMVFPVFATPVPPFVPTTIPETFVADVAVLAVAAFPSILIIPVNAIEPIFLVFEINVVPM